MATIANRRYQRRSGDRLLDGGHLCHRPGTVHHRCLVGVLTMSGSSPAAVSDETERGTLHFFVAFDWGEEIDLDRARKLAPGEVHDLPRRRRTPTSFAYRPAPLEIDLG